jgi:amino-acid N-acetyltransferase
MGAVTLRSATPDDLPAIVSLLAAVHLPPNEAEQHIHNFVVGERDGRVVACGGLEAYPEASACLVRSMAVEESLQGSGVGSEIMDWVLDRARELGLRDLFLFTMAAADFYRRYGFRDATLDEFPPAARHSAQYQAVSRYGEEWGVIAMRREPEVPG